MASEHCDVVVIGSGFGGSVCAMRAASAQRSVVVLERGARLTRESREEMAEGRQPLFYAARGRGLIERAAIRGLQAVTASAVGGGSHLYTAVTIPAPAEVFLRGWPQGLNAETMSPYYARVAEVIAPTPIPHALPRTSALQGAGNSLGAAVTLLPLAMDWPADPAAMNVMPAPLPIRREVTTWLQGGPAAQKRTLDRTYLARAQAAGADIRPLHEATLIEPAPPGFRVRFRRYDTGPLREESLTAAQVVLAAGTLGTVRLLLHCRDVARTLPAVSSALGRRFFTNGDFGGLLIRMSADLVRDSGPPATAWLDWWKQDRVYLMEAGLLPPLPKLLTRALGLLLPSSNGGASEPVVWSFGTMGLDQTPGTLVLERGRLRLVRGNDGHCDFHERTITRLRELAMALRAKLILPPGTLAPPGSVTVHPLGGAAMGDSPQSGVADSSGGVFGYPGLFVADGSLLPTPVGRAPSMTITALAERVAERLVGGD